MKRNKKMSLLIKEQDIQALYNFYGLPVKVKKWLSSPETYHQDDEFDLHEDLCDLHPEDALICIALCCYVVLEDVGSSRILDFSELQECIDYLISDYGFAALERIKTEADPDEDCDIHGVATDLTKLSRVLEEFESKIMMVQAEMLSSIMGVLSIQAAAQADIVRYVLSALWEEGSEERKEAPEISAEPIPFYATPPVNDNINAY